jgi:hypothetical protein
MTRLTNEILDSMPTRYSTEPLRFELRPTHCRRGKPGDKFDCAVALGLRAADPAITGAAVKLTVAYVLREGDDHKTHYFLPESLRRVVAVNDGQGQSETGWYELKPSAKAIAAKPTGRKGGTKKGAGKTGYRHISTRQR